MKIDKITIRQLATEEYDYYIRTDDDNAPFLTSLELRENLIELLNDLISRIKSLQKLEKS